MRFLFLKISHFTTFPRMLWFSILTRGLGNFAVGYYANVSLLRQSFSESLEASPSSKKRVICEISHFASFNRNFVYFPWIKDLTALQVLKTLNGINMTTTFLKRKSLFTVSFKKFYFSEFCILPLFLDACSTFFLHTFSLNNFSGI